jgi:spermidine/putrescine transport system substrate-binding protein
MVYFTAGMKNIKLSLQLKIIFAAVAVLVGFVACSKNEKSAEALAAPESSADRVLRLYTWADYFDESTIEAFKDQTGIDVEYATFGSTDDMEAKLKSEPGKWDVIVADDSILDQMWELKLIRELDHSLLPNLKNIDDEYRVLPFDPGNRFSAPYMWGTTLVAYRKDKIADPGDSWDLLWNPEYKGKVMMIGERFEVLSIPLLLLGHDLNSSEPAHMTAATDMLLQQINDVDVRIGDDSDVRKGLIDERVWAAMCYSGDAALVAEQDENIGFFIPKEGAPLWIDSFAVVRDTSMSKEAHLFVNFMLDAKMAAANTNFTCYASPNEAAREFIDPELLEDKSINPPAEVMERCHFFTKLSAEREEHLNGAWLRVHTRLREKDAEVVEGVASSGVDAELEGVDSK